MSAETSPVYAPEAWSAQFWAASSTLDVLSKSAMLAKWVNGAATIRPTDEGVSADLAATAFASSIPSGRVVFIFQFPATIFLRIFIGFWFA
jgi:hypothetical protein